MGNTRARERQTAGRPRKFLEASRPVTVTLPERTLKQLAAISADRARAIAKVVEVATGSADGTAAVQVVEVEKGTGIILVGPIQSLRRIPWLRLVEVSPCRYLLSVPTGTSVDSLEVAILDLVDHLPSKEADERPTLLKLCELFRRLRRGQSVSKAEILIVKTRP